MRAAINLAPATSAQYGGYSSRDQCANLPAAVRSGCQWRFDWFADNPTISSIQRVVCPSQLTDISGCRRTDQAGLPYPPQ